MKHNWPRSSGSAVNASGNAGSDLGFPAKRSKQSNVDSNKGAKLIVIPALRIIGKTTKLGGHS